MLSLRQKQHLVCIYRMLILMYFIQYLILRKKQGHVKRRKVERQRYRPPIPYNPWVQFTLDGLDDVLCSSLTRFTRTELDRFLPLLGLEEIQFRNRVRATLEEALAVVLIKLSFPNRYWEMMDWFGHSRTWLSIVFNDTMIYFYRHYRKKLAWNENRLTYEQLSIYAMAIHQFGGGSCFWGFIDGTLNATC